MSSTDRRGFSFPRLVVEVVLLVILGRFILDPVAAAAGVDVNTVGWMFARFALFVVAFWTFLPMIVDKILDIVDFQKK